MSRDELVEKLAKLLTEMLVPVEMRWPSEAVQTLVREIVGDMPVSAIYHPDALAAHLRQRLESADPRFPADRVALDFDGNLLADHGVRTGAAVDHTGGVFTYAVATVTDAVRLHRANRVYRAAASGLRPRTSQADRDYVLSLEREFLALRDELEVKP